jgi:hypothetical protein
MYVVDLHVGCSGPESLLLGIAVQTFYFSEGSESRGNEEGPTGHDGLELPFSTRLPTDIQLASTNPLLSHQKEGENLNRVRRGMAAGR